MTARSYLFVPGDRAAMLARAGERGADAVIADEAVVQVARRVIATAAPAGARRAGGAS